MSNHSDGTGEAHIFPAQDARVQYEAVMAMFDHRAPADSGYILDAIENIAVRDAIMHSLSDKFLISLHGDECDAESNHALRHEFADFLTLAGEDAGRWNAAMFDIVQSFMLYDGHEGEFLVTGAIRSARDITTGLFEAWTVAMSRQMPFDLIRFGWRMSVDNQDLADLLS